MESPARESCCELVRYMSPGDPYSIYRSGLTTTCVLHIALYRAYYTYHRVYHYTLPGSVHGCMYFLMVSVLHVFPYDSVVGAKGNGRFDRRRGRRGSFPRASCEVCWTLG